MGKKYLLTLILVFVLAMTTGCGLISKGKEKIEDALADGNGTEETDEKSKEKAEAEKEVSTELGDYQVMLGGDIEEKEDQYIVHGESNLLPGSRIVGEVIVDEGETVFSDTSEIVQDDGSFYMELEHNQYGEAEIVIRFDFENVQEDEVKRHYGEKGQKLEGPFIYRHETFDGIFNKAEARIDYNPNGENDLAIKAPNWEEMPEDYGDPRVWIEVDELTEDGEFFYMHGRSNLLEGSEIKVEYKYNKDTTRVNPDGSFDFKFDYEYLEDKDIVITFDPSGFQWNEIEEAYGTTGQKLIGNLVETNQFNTEKQYIEKRIEWDSEASKMKSDTKEEDTDDEEKEKDDTDKKNDKAKDEDKK